MAANPLKFEEALKALEDIVSKMEKGELPLEESIAYFEQGMQLTRLCESKLAEAEGKVEKLLESSVAGGSKPLTSEPSASDELAPDSDEDIPF
jgi:exodeoxyribonuclease VII small subunit